MLFQMCRPVSSNVVSSNMVNNIPPTFLNTLDYHGLNIWREAKAIEFTVKTDNGNESYQVDLDSRSTMVSADDFTIFKNMDGCYVAPNLEAFKSNPFFYHSVYYYFVSMPFVLADPGINYETLGDFAIDDTLFHGVKISYNDGVGDASKDEYIVLSDKETHEMRYLLYTVTYFTNERSTEWGAKRYGKWKRINGILLPTELISYKYDDHKLLEQSSVVNIVNIDCSMTALPKDTFSPKGDHEQWEQEQ